MGKRELELCSTWWEGQYLDRRAEHSRLTAKR
jgi:hypothetical protein